MKNIFAFTTLLLLFSISCSKKNPDDATYPDEKYVEAKYDTTPKDSFANGATSVDIERKIRMSSYAYQDSIKKMNLQMEQEKKMQEEKAKLEKDAKKTLEKENPKTKENAAPPKPEIKPSEFPTATDGNQTPK